MDVFEIERYATEDGPGIRTVLFLKGCNLSCVWCQNPESQSRKPQVMYYRKQCTACGKCIEACPVGAVSVVEPYGYIADHETCTLFGACVDACFYDARRIVGRSYTLDELFRELLKDRSYFDESGGGVTFSGGEPLLQAEEVAEFAKRLRAEGLHVAVETAGYVDWRTFERLIPHVDLFFLDFKHIDSALHERYTGVPNERILENMNLLAGRHEQVVIRIPVVPEVNDSPELMERMFRYLREETPLRKVELLPYHRLGMGKYHGLGRPYEMDDARNLSKEECEPLAEVGRSLGIEVKVGAE